MRRISTKEYTGNKIGRITTNTTPAISEYAIPTAASNPGGIAAGADGALWSTESSNNKIRANYNRRNSHDHRVLDPDFDE
ncbi:MAG: hypothetical protein ACREM8_05930 [Vulcanimicrobiaceae bacterium]